MTINFIENKYHKLYFRLIKSHKPNDDQYTEFHHIIPKSLGGSDAKSNIKKVSSRVHYILHFLLTKFTINDAFHSMVKAFNMMHTGHNDNRYKNAKLYEINRKHMSNTMSLLQKGKNNSQYGKIWMTNSIVNSSSRFYINDIENAISQGWIIGRKSSKFINKMNNSLCHSIEAKKSRQVKLTNRIFKEKQSKIENYIQNNPSKCTHCNNLLEYDKRNNKFCSHICSATHQHIKN